MLTSALLALPMTAMADDCAAPPRPVFDISGADLDVAGYNAVTDMLIEFDDLSVKYRACLDETINARSEGWVDALESYNQSSAVQSEVYEAYVVVSEDFVVASEQRAAEAAEQQRQKSAELAEVHLGQLEDGASPSESASTDAAE